MTWKKMRSRTKMKMTLRRMRMRKMMRNWILKRMRMNPRTYQNKCISINI